MEINAQISKAQTIQGNVNEVPGSSITKENIVDALGYTPADAPDVLLCTISGSGTTASPYACDRSTTEILVATQAGKLVLAKYGNTCLPLATISGVIAAVFAGATGASSVRVISVMRNGSVSVTSTTLQSISERKTSISESSTNSQYPTAKAVWDAIPHITVDTIDLDSSQLDTSGWEEYTAGVFRLQVQTYQSGTVLGIFITQFGCENDSNGIIPQVALLDGASLSILTATSMPVTFSSMQIQVVHI